jgi:ABC-type multidrug transport system ATPase subunit
LSKTVTDEFSAEEMRQIEAFRLDSFLNRDINVGFSGGERKRSEILQLIFMKPKLLLLDEPDSGVDAESLRLIASEIERYVESSGSSSLIITRKGDILDYIKATYGCILLEGKFHCYTHPMRIYEDIKKWGMRNVSLAEEGRGRDGQVNQESDLIRVPHRILEEAEKAGLESTGQSRAGTFFHLNQETVAKRKGVEITHEAAVGKISEKENCLFDDSATVKRSGCFPTNTRFH